MCPSSDLLFSSKAQQHLITKQQTSDTSERIGRIEMEASGGGGVGEAGKREAIASGSIGGNDNANQSVGSSSALQSYLDHIPLSAISSIHASFPVLEVKYDDSVEHGIRLLYENNVSGAPILDPAEALSRKSMDRDIGFIEFSSMVLWSLEEIDKVKTESKQSNQGFLDELQKTPQIGQIKIVELAKSYLWEPFFPVHEDDTLFHALLLFSKHHRLNVIPVADSSNSRIVGFITQHAVVQLLLQSSGLAWFDEIAEKPLTEFGLIKSSGAVSVYRDQSLADTLHVLWDKQLNEVPIVERSGALWGCVRRSDIHILLENDSLFNERKKLTVEEFTKVRNAECKRSSDPSEENEPRCSGLLRLKNVELPPVNSMVVLRKSDSLKKAMEDMVASISEGGFLTSGSGELEGTVTLRDIILPFSPPSMDSRIDGGGFFTSLLNQANCHVENGEMIRNL